MGWASRSRQRGLVLLAGLFFAGYLLVSEQHNGGVDDLLEENDWTATRLRARQAQAHVQVTSEKIVAQAAQQQTIAPLQPRDAQAPQQDVNQVVAKLPTEGAEPEQPKELTFAQKVFELSPKEDDKLSFVVDVREPRYPIDVVDREDDKTQLRNSEEAGALRRVKNGKTAAPLQQYSTDDDMPATLKKLADLLDTKLRPSDALKPAADFKYPVTDPKKRANAAAVILARNGDADELVNVLESYEDSFNSADRGILLKHSRELFKPYDEHGVCSDYHYPYVVLNDEPFTEEFKEAVVGAVSSTVTFVQLPARLWDAPEWIDKGKYQEALREMANKKVFHGDNPSYHQMCRFFSGPIFDVPEVAKYDYYWRIDSTKVRFHCRIDFDPFVFMQERDIVYGFNIAVHELMDTVPTLWNQTLAFMDQNTEMIKGDWLNYFTEDGTEYNGHHFWSNFEIGSTKFFTSPEYRAYFDYLDKSGGFFYERWGDAPVHSIALGLFALRSQVYFFNEIGYTHDDMTHCPIQHAMFSRCGCHGAVNINQDKNSPLYQFLNLHPKTLPQLEADLQRGADRLADIHNMDPPSCPYGTSLVVEENGQWVICQEPGLNHPCIVYSFTVKNGATSLDLEKDLARKGCVVHYFNQWGREGEIASALRSLGDHYKDAMKWHQISLGSRDGFHTRKPEKLFIQERRFATLRKELGHSNLPIDVLKFDIEGDEWTVLAEMLYTNSLEGVNYIMFESHYTPEDLWQFGSVLPELVSSLMTNAGFELVSLTRNPHGKEVVMYDLAIPCCYKWVFRRADGVFESQE